MKARGAIGALSIFIAAAGHAQKPPELKPSAQGFLFLPVALGSPIFDNLTDVLGQVDGTFQLPVYKGFGAGVGVNATFYELNDRGLAPERLEQKAHQDGPHQHVSHDQQRLGAARFDRATGDRHELGRATLGGSDAGLVLLHGVSRSCPERALLR